MPIAINKISNKYINKLEQKKILKSVGFNDAVSAIKEAVDETANMAKTEIENAIKPLSAKIAQKDEFISQQKKENDELKKINSDLQSKYKNIYKEAYRQGITPEIREQKSGIANILSGLLKNKETPQKVDIQPEQAKPKEEVIVKPAPKTVKQAKVEINPQIIQEIKEQRMNQRLDKERMESASAIIYFLLNNAPKETTYNSVQDHFKKTIAGYLSSARNRTRGDYKFKKDNYGDIRISTDQNGKEILRERGFYCGRKGVNYNNRDSHPYQYEIFVQDGSSIEICDLRSDSYIEFRDTKGKNLLKILYGDYYQIFISDKDGNTMISSSIENGAVKYLNVKFNDVKPIQAIENDEQMNLYAQNLINKAKENCTAKEKKYNDTTDIDYFNAEGKQTVHEYYVNKSNGNSIPVFTYIFNPETQKLEKVISTGDFGIHVKLNPKNNSWIQYRTKGITSIDKIRSDGELQDFSIGFHKNTDNEHFETISLYNKQYEADKSGSLQRPVYEVFNYGLASYPLTKSFTFYDLSQRNIKPWDFSILKHYIK